MPANSVSGGLWLTNSRIVPLFLLLFASAYVVMERLARASFTQPRTHTDALYFTVTVFTTVEFGDITARTEAAWVLVTIQMIMDLVIIVAAIHAIVGAARHGRERRSAGSLLCVGDAPDPPS
jgi:voltage-gated potassium channel